ncbi:MAG: hydroxyacid dehydrogenase [Bauldia sp.]|nr:hydroxyacid dehydrogenase [Bauldia sp.]
MRILIAEVQDWERDLFEAAFRDHDLTLVEAALDERVEADLGEVEIVSTFVSSSLTGEVLARMPRLRLIATRSTGFDHIDLETCRQRGILVSNVPYYGDVTVAEHVFALLLALVRHIPEALERTRRGDFSQEGLRGFDLHGKVLGVIGTGRIGRRVIGIARGFGMEVVAYDVAPDEAEAARLGFRYATLGEVLRAADVLTLHVPASAATLKLIGDAEFAAMKEGAVLINTSRGSVIDAEALVRAIASGRLAAVGLDVLPEESALREEAAIFATRQQIRPDLRTLIADHILLDHPRVIVTPHIAYNTREAVRRIAETTIANILGFAGGAPQNLVGRA